MTREEPSQSSPVGLASSPEGGANPFRLAASRQATFPKGTALAVAGNFAAAPKGVPLGEVALRSKD